MGRRPHQRVNGRRALAALGVAAGALALALPAHGAGRDTPPVIVTKRVAVVLFNFRDDGSQPFTAEQARLAVFDDPDSPAAFYRQVSGGAVALTGTVFGWITIDASTSDCRPTPTFASDAAWDTSARRTLAAMGIDLSGFDYVLYGMPSLSCFGGGRATHTCSYRTCTRQAFVYNAGRFLGHRVAVHELGHLIGSDHANRYRCTDPTGQAVAISASCQSVEYGDPFVVMGSDNGEFDAYRRASLGWLAPQELQTVTESGTYTLSPIELPGGVRALKVPKDRDASGAVKGYYWLEFRRPLGFDGFLAGLSAARRDGLQIRVAPGEEKRFAATYLIDTTPDTPSGRDQPLAPGRAFYDAGSATLIENLGVADGALHVRIRLGLPADTTPPAAPARVWDGGGARDVARATTTSQNELFLNWSPAADEPDGSGLAGYDYCIATKTSARGCAGTIVGAWSPAAQPPADFITGAIALRTGRRYFGCVRARDNAGNVSQPRCSDGQVR